ncbi:MAG: hypothetical protein M1817_003574 [Caeruleum heppii]|nr:MAG: hypothetical protein M1817_003574 [Caeruleum heppii]
MSIQDISNVQKPPEYGTPYGQGHGPASTGFSRGTFPESSGSRVAHLAGSASTGQLSSAWDVHTPLSSDRGYMQREMSESPTAMEFPRDLRLQQHPVGKSRSADSHGQRRPSQRDEFDGPHQLLARPPAEVVIAQEQELPTLPTSLYIHEQDEVLSKVNDRLSQCAFDFIAKYQFPIPLESDKRPVRVPADREWTEWVWLLKRLATKRRIPARVLYNGQIKQLVTVLENSLEMRHAAVHSSRPLKDDRNVLQLISAGIQVTKMLKDAPAMECMDRLYVSTQRLIRSRTSPPVKAA